jgi:hypothetical protein
MRKILIFLTITFLFISCAKEEASSPVSDSSKTRSFYLGFTPWLYAATTPSETATYDYINSQGDLIAHHFQQGIPFDDASTFPNFENYETNIKNEVNNRIVKTGSGKIVYLAIDSLNSARNDLTDFWGTNANSARVTPWDTRSFDDTEVISAYTNFALELIARFNPTYFNYAPEISDLMINSPAKFVEFQTFSAAIYTNIKAAFPNLKIMVSIALKEPGSAHMITATTGFDAIKDDVDLVGISTYGYAFYGHANAGDPDNLPATWLSQIQTIAPGKSYAIVETGWVAEDLSIPAFGLNVTSSEANQKKYIEKMFTEADAMDMEAIIWFASHDYSTLWTDTLGSDNLSQIWKDTGLVDDSLVSREGHTLWDIWLGYSKD